MDLRTARQCKYCNTWHDPSALDTDGECHVCAPYRESRQLAAQLEAAGDDLGRELRESVEQAVISANQLRFAGL